MNVKERVFDDLTIVKGIGEKRQQWLQEALGIFTYQGLANLSVNEIESQLKADGHVASRNVIEGWIEQARELTSLVDANPQKSSGDVVETVDPKADLSKGKRSWSPFASFVVEFQTRLVAGLEEQRTTVHYMEEDTNAVWPGVEQEQLCRWMKGQAGEKVRPKSNEDNIDIPEDVGDVSELGEKKPVRVEIKELRAFHPPNMKTPTGVGKPGRPFMGFIRSMEPCTFKVTCELVGASKTKNYQDLLANYHVQLHARNLSMGNTTRVDMRDAGTDESKMVPGEAAFIVPLAKTSLQPGMYRFGIVVRENSPLSSINYLEFPVLHVV